MTITGISSILRLGAGAVVATGMSVGMASAWNFCYEDCGGGCSIQTSCSSCYEGDPYDCIIFFNSGDIQCYQNARCDGCASCWFS